MSAAAPEVGPAAIAGSVPLELLRGILDDAATFPPGNATMADSVEARAMYADTWFAPLLGAVVLRADRTEELLDVLAGCEHAPRQVDGPLPVTVTVPGGPTAVAEAVRAVKHRALAAVAFEVPLGHVQPDTALLLRTRMEVPADAALHVELSSVVDPAHAMPVLAEAGVRGKLRTGGTTASAFPDVATVARFVHAAVQARVPFKATAGLHNALRHRDEDTGFEHHGFVNLLAGTAAALLHGATEHQVGVLLASTEPDPLLEVLTGLDADQALAVRRAFVSFGTCSTVEPVEDLAGLGMIVRPGIGA